MVQRVIYKGEIIVHIYELREKMQKKNPFVPFSGGSELGEKKIKKLRLA